MFAVAVMLAAASAVPLAAGAAPVPERTPVQAAAQAPARAQTLAQAPLQVEVQTGGPAPAPRPDRTESLNLVPPAEAQALRQQLAAPVPEGASAEVLRRHFATKLAAAERLGDDSASRAVLREAIARLPDEARWHNALATQLREDGALGEARRHYELALQRTHEPTARLLVQANLARLSVARHEPDAEQQITAVRAGIEPLLAATPPPPPSQRLALVRALAHLAGSEGTLLARRGRHAQVLKAAELYEQHARTAMGMVQNIPGASRNQVRAAASTMAAGQMMRAAALRNLERDAEAEQVLLAHLEHIQRYEVGADHAAAAHASLGMTRLLRHEYAAAERQYRLALKVLDDVGEASASPQRASYVAEVAALRWAQGRPAEGLAEWEAFDRAAGPQGQKFARRFPFSRGIVLLGVGRVEEAARHFGELAKGREKELGPAHSQTLGALALQGVAWFRHGDAATRERGAEQLKQAVLDLQQPVHADELNDRGLRRPLRELVYQTYVQAMAARGGVHALAAMGVADQLRSGLTAQAMGDAAVRAAAIDPALAALAREEQDARREQQAIEAALLGLDSGEAPPPETAAQLRARVAAIEAQRAEVQRRIRERFPGYDRLVRPALPDPTAVAQRLARGEALVMLVPTEGAVLAWLILADAMPHFARLEIPARELQALVARVRRTLDFSAGPPQPFDHAAAEELYRRLLAPLAPQLASAGQLVIAVSGPLATLPFAALQTGPAIGGEPAWLPRRYAFVQVPSVAAWLALRQLSRTGSASEALIGYGDPAFSHAAAAAPAQRGPAGAARGVRQLLPPSGHATRQAADGPARAEAAGAPPPELRYDQLPPLPETRDELRAIAAALKADPVRDLRLGAQATRESFLEASRAGLLARKRVLVLATHGLMAGELPGVTQPALAMAAAAPPAQAPANDEFSRNLLTLSDVLGLKLNADWVVLSACNTAAADGRAEEALSGLARGFFYAGSRSVLVTQWAVETESAKRLTTATFEHHARVRTASKAESLRQAMLQVMGQPGYAHPAFWAPYMLVGDAAR